MQTKYYFAVDIGGTKIKFGVFNDKKILIDVFKVDTVIAKTNSEKNLIDYVFDTIDKYCESNKYHIKTSDIKGIGFTIPGPVVNGKVIMAVNINWKKNYDIKAAVKRRYGKNVSCVVGNDGNFAALGEYVFALKKKVDSICMFTIGTAIGTGVIINGKLIEGKHGIAGELSHLKVDYSEDSIKCNCGNYGCLETVAGGKAIFNIYRRLYPNDKRIFDGAKDIVKLAKQGDKKCKNVLTASFDYLSVAIASTILTYEPEIIIIGGGVSNGGKIVTDILTKQVKEKIGISKFIPKIIISKYKNKAGLYGAVAEL